MQITTADGIDIFCLPDNAVCTATGRSPEKMLRCPCMQFDAFGEICQPGECEYYTEDENYTIKEENDNEYL